MELAGRDREQDQQKLTTDDHDEEGIPLLHGISGQDDGNEGEYVCAQVVCPSHDSDDRSRTVLYTCDDQNKSAPGRRRLASLDVFRGLTIAVMILVDDAGGLWPSINHSPWHGVTLADFVMPFFLFIVGMSLVLAFKNTQHKVDAVQKVSFRALKLSMLGVFLQGAYFGEDFHYGVDIKHIRIMGILQRISIAYVLVACCEIVTKKDPISRENSQSHEVYTGQLLRAHPWHWALVLLLSSIYLGVLYGVTVPDWQFKSNVSRAFSQAMETTVLRVGCNVRGNLGPACNAVGFVDRTILGINHLYQHPMYIRTKECSTQSPDYGPLPANAPPWCFAPFDPEGLMSSLMAVASCVIGAHYGHALVYFKEHKRRLVPWIMSGILLILLGLFVDWLGMPLNKPLYTISYVCITAGAAGLLFSLTYVLVDVWNYRKPFLLLEWMGMNALLIYVLAAEKIFSDFIGAIYWDSPHNNLVSLVEVGVFQHIINSEKWAKMGYVLLEIFFWCLVAGILKKRGIFWKF